MRDQVRDYFDRIADRYDQAYHRRPETAAEDAIVAAWLKASIPVSASILDVGSGTGWFLDQIGWPRGMYRGFDLSPAMVEQARRKHPGYTIEVGDAAGPWPSWRQDWRDGTPRWATALWSLNYVGEPQVTLRRFAGSAGDRLAAVVRTPLELRPMSAFTEPMFIKPWTPDQITKVAGSFGLLVEFPLAFRYGGDQVPSWRHAHYLCMEVGHVASTANR